MEGERIREDTPSQHLTKSSVELSVRVLTCVYVCVSVFTRFACVYIIRQFNMSDVCTLLYYKCMHTFILLKIVGRKNI